MTKREQLRYNVIQQLKEEIAKVEKLDDRGLANYIDALPDCSPCIFDSRKCNEYCSERIFNYLLNHGDEEASNKMTNREWLSTLTDEEFVRIMCSSCESCTGHTSIEKCNSMLCRDGRIEWLKQEHKEDSDDKQTMA